MTLSLHNWVLKRLGAILVTLRFLVLFSRILLWVELNISQVKHPFPCISLRVLGGVNVYLFFRLKARGVWLIRVHKRSLLDLANVSKVLLAISYGASSSLTRVEVDLVASRTWRRVGHYHVVYSWDRRSCVLIREDSFLNLKGEKRRVTRIWRYIVEIVHFLRSFNHTDVLLHLNLRLPSFRVRALL